MKLSNKIIVLTQNEEHNALIQQVASRCELSVEENDMLHSVDVIAHEIETKKSTAFLRSALHAFIKENGIPFMVVIDCPVTALTPNDATMQKIFRTMLISFMIIARGSGFANIKANFFTLVTSGDINVLKSSIINPERLINAIKTNDEKVNEILKLYASQKTFESLFYIKLYSPSSNQELAAELIAYIEAVKKRHAMIEKLLEKQKYAQSKDREAAKVLVKIHDDKIVIDHEIIVTHDSTYKKYLQGHIYVLGDWTNIHSRKVAGKVITAIKDGFADWKLSNDDQVAIHLEDALVDHITAATLVQIIFNDLRAFSNVKIYCSEKNYKILESANGFSLIKKLLFIQKI